MMKTISKILFILLIVSLAGSIGYLYTLGRRSSAKVSGNIYLVMPKNSGNEANEWTVKNIESLHKDYEEAAIAYECHTQVTVQNMGKSAEIDLVTTDSDYRRTCGITMKQGNFFLEDHGNEKEVVIDEQAAFELWGTENCLGETLEIEEAKWRIIGIVENETKDEKTGKIYRLGSTLEMPPTIHWLYIRLEEDLQSQNQSTLKQMLESIGHSAEDNQIVSLTPYRQQIADERILSEKGLMLLILAGVLWEAISLLMYMMKQYKGTRQQYYLSEYIKKHLWSVLGLGSIAVTSAAGAVTGIKHLASSMLEVLYSRESFADTAYKLPEAIVQLQKDNAMAQWICISGLAMGVIIVGWGLIKLNLAGQIQPIQVTSDSLDV